MTQKDDDFLRKLRAGFQVEAREHLQAMASGLLELEHARTGERARETISTIFREAHSLKGAARAVDLPEIELICQSIESIFSAWRKQGTPPASEAFDPLLDAIALIERLLPGPDGLDAPAPRREELSTLLARLETFALTPPASTWQPAESDQAAPVQPSALSPAAHAASGAAPRQQQQREGAAVTRAVAPDAETLRISAARLDNLLREAEELLPVKSNMAQRYVEIRSIARQLEDWRREWARVAPEIAAIRHGFSEGLSAGHGGGVALAAAPDTAVDRVVEFLEWNHAHIRRIEQSVSALAAHCERDRRSIGGMVDTLLEDVKQLMMLPFSTLFEALPRLVRDLMREVGRQVELELRGAEVEIDKRILEELKDPLIHLLRNAVDHAIEPPEQRVQAGKPQQGRITVTVSQVEGREVELVVSDDGRGIDPAQVRAAAVRLGALSAEEAEGLEEADALRLIFQPELSTRQTLTSISGRGLGLAIVMEKVEELGGRITVESKLGQGTRFRMFLPVTLATFRGVLVQVSGQTLVIPAALVDRVGRVARASLRTVENCATIVLDGRTVPLVPLRSVLELPPLTEAVESSFISFVVLGSGDRQVAFEVDIVLEEQEVLVKPLTPPLLRVRNIAGATVLGSGRPAPILNVSDVMRSVSRIADASLARPRTTAREEDEESALRSILVVDDSITARMLLKNILEQAGYRVSVAVDGLAALTVLKTEPFDLVISDVEMPRMDGFELTARLRSEEQFQDLPVILVTARSSPDDRERGAEAGANAYIVKSSFDQSDLLKTVERLL